MPPVHFGPCLFDADLIIFDKDGTLIDFIALYGGKIATAIETLIQGVQGTAALHADLCATLGYDAQTARFDSQSPVLTATLPTIYTVAATSLYRHGWGWLPAELQVAAHFAPMLEGPFTPAMLQPTADLPRLFGALTQAGVQIAVITSDDHAPTATALAWLDIAQQVQMVIGADDAYPHKPAPEAIWAVCTAMGVELSRTAYVGDSTTDMLMAQRAAVGLRVAVLTGLMDAATLAPHADLLLASVGEIHVANQVTTQEE